MNFDPYHQWLGISPSEQPPNHYRLLGITPFETDPAVISQAADQRAAQIRTVQAGEHAHLSQRILNEIAGAKLSLLDPTIKRSYDADLAKRMPPPLPRQIAKTPAKSHTVRHHRSSSLVALILAGAGLALACGAIALALWWLNADSQKNPAKDQADSRAVASSQEQASSASSSTEAEEPTEHHVTEVASAKTPEPPKSPPPTTVASPPIVTPPAVTSVPAQETDPATTMRVQKGKGKKKTVKKPQKSAPRGRNRPTGDPAIASSWLSPDGQLITLVQQQDQFTATGVGTDSDHPGVIWRWSGTVDKDGHLSGRLVYTLGPSNSVDQGVTATLLSDCNTIEGTGLKVGMPDFPWTKGKTLPKLR